MTLYTTKARLYDKMIESAGKHYKDEARLIANIIRNNANGNQVLDLGCGTGTHAAELIRQGFKVICGDLSKEMLAIAKKKTKAECIKINMRNFKLRTRVNAVICLYNTIMYNKNKKELESTFNCCHNCLAPKGIFIIQVTNPDLLQNAKDSSFVWDLGKNEKVIQTSFVTFPKLINHFLFVNTLNKKEESDWHEMTIFPAGTIKALLKKCGFRNIILVKHNAALYITCTRS